MTKQLIIGLGGTGGRVVGRILDLLPTREPSEDLRCAVLDMDPVDLERMENVPLRGNLAVHQTVRGCFECLGGGMPSWAVKSPQFTERSMGDSASCIRMLGRVGFLRFLESGSIIDLEHLVAGLRRNDPGAGLQITLVTSLAGGTGSGIFLQVALWLRRHLQGCNMGIRGVFVLPDVFAGSFRDLWQNRRLVDRMYANTYAALMELETLGEISFGGAELSAPVALDGLFDSTRDALSGRRLFDAVYLLDDRDENGICLESIAEYEEQAARLLLLQTLSPMQTHVMAEEYKWYCAGRKEQVFASAGTARAVYPKSDILDYCGIRSALRSIGQWQMADVEIVADGDGRAAFRKAYEAGRSTVPMAQDFIGDLRSRVVKAVLDERRMLQVHVLPELLEGMDATVLMSMVNRDEHIVLNWLGNLMGTMQEFAQSLVEKSFSRRWDRINLRDKQSIPGMLQSDSGDTLPPTEARYVLTCLLLDMQSFRQGLQVEEKRENAFENFRSYFLFDNPATSKCETTPMEFLNSKKWYQGERRFLKSFVQAYQRYMERWLEACIEYGISAMMDRVLRDLESRVECLLRQYERICLNVEQYAGRLMEKLEDNIRRNEGIHGKTVYVYASREHKEDIYHRSEPDSFLLPESIKQNLLRDMLRAVCFEIAPEEEENRAFAPRQPGENLPQELQAYFREKISSDAVSRKVWDLDLFHALGCQEDARYSGTEEELRDIASGDAEAVRRERHRAALSACKRQLWQMAAPNLNLQGLEEDTCIFPLVLWGCRESIGEGYALREKLGSFEALVEDEAFCDTELICYRQSTGFTWRELAKFRENGTIRRGYDRLVEAAAREDGTELTPHLDKTWHEILPV